MPPPWPPLSTSWLLLQTPGGSTLIVYVFLLLSNNYMWLHKTTSSPQRDKSEWDAAPAKHWKLILHETPSPQSCQTTSLLTPGASVYSGPRPFYEPRTSAAVHHDPRVGQPEDDGWEEHGGNGGDRGGAGSLRPL